MRDSVLDAARTADRSLESLLARMKDAAFVVEVASGRIRSWNLPAARIFGYSADDMQDLPLALLFTGPHEGLVDAIAALAPVTLRATAKDGRALIIEMTLSPLGNGLAIALARDVSDRLCPELARDRALNILSHELRTPISTVLGYADLMLDGLAGPVTDQQRHCLERLLVAADDLHALVNDCLDLGLIHVGKLGVSPQALRVSEVVTATIEGLALQAEGKSVAITHEVCVDLPLVMADRKRLAQVLRNLLSNAIKYCPEGGKVWVRARLEADALCCEIEDTGPGIPLDAQATIFQPFVRLADGSVPGAGLGLNIAEALIKAHDGTIGVRNAEGGGAIFWFTLPLA